MRPFADGDEKSNSSIDLGADDPRKADAETACKLNAVGSWSIAIMRSRRMPPPTWSSQMGV
jgi:hypothetical protein